MAKIHLFISSRPLRPGENVAAQCGDLVTKSGKDVILICHMDEQRSGDDVSQIIHAWDNVPTGSKIDWPAGIGICGKCIKAAEKKHEGPLFVYAIVSKTER